jgi:hypothetical protein
MQVSMEARPTGQQSEGVLARAMGALDWLAGTTPAEPSSARSSRQSGGEEDFLRQTAGPDERRASQTWLAPPQGFTTPEEEWRHDCLAFARLKDLSHVEEMRAFYLDPRSDGGAGEEGCATVVAVAAHYKRNVASQEECLLHIVKEMEKVGPSRPYNLVYFNAFAELSAIPDNIFFQQVHAALHPSHKRNMKAFYILHPTWLLKYWVFMLRLAIPEIYGRVKYLDRLSDLEALMPAGSLEIPQHVRDYDSTLK